MRDTFVIMAKYPEEGRVKTRLADSVGAVRACALYRAFLRDLHAEFRGARYEVVWAMSPAGSRLDDVLEARDLRSIDQRGAGLGERMHNCFADLFAAGADRVVMIGADIPHLGAPLVEQVFGTLDLADVVLVPSRDGGYCLVAASAPLDIFTPVEMGTARVFEQTRRLCSERGLSLRQLDASFDIDELEDVRELAALLDGTARLPVTQGEIAVWRKQGLL